MLWLGKLGGSNMPETGLFLRAAAGVAVLCVAAAIFAFAVEHIVAILLILAVLIAAVFAIRQRNLRRTRV